MLWRAYAYGALQCFVCVECDFPPTAPDPLLQARHFSIGCKLVCRKKPSVSAKHFEPLRVYPSQAGGGSETFVIDGLLSEGKASIHVVGEAYTARLEGEADDGDAVSNGSYHIVHISFEPINKLPSLATSDAMSTAAGKTLSTVLEGERHPAPTTQTQDNGFSGSTKMSTREAGGASSGGNNIQTTASAPSSSRSLVGSTYMRGGDYVPVLKAVGRAAMVGFHAGLAGALRNLTWGSRELTLVVDAVPIECFTLREALSGKLYRGTGTASTAGREQQICTADVVDRMLTLARQLAEAISHCHRRWVSCGTEVYVVGRPSTSRVC